MHDRPRPDAVVAGGVTAEPGRLGIPASTAPQGRLNQDTCPSGSAVGRWVNRAAGRVRAPEGPVINRLFFALSMGAVSAGRAPSGQGWVR